MLETRLASSSLFHVILILVQDGDENNRCEVNRSENYEETNKKVTFLNGLSKSLLQ